MAGKLPVLTNKDRNRTKNKKASDEAIPFVYQTVIGWGCQKKDDETFLDYYTRRAEELWNDNKDVWEEEMNKDLEKRTQNWTEGRKKTEKEKCSKNLKEEMLKKHLIREKWTQEEKEQLDQDTCEGLDATLLHKLLPTICDGIGRYNPTAPSSTEIEKFLREVKNKRNQICHEPKKASVSGTILDELEVSAVNVFKAAGDVYTTTITQQTVRDKIDELKEKLQKIKNEVLTDDFQRVLQIAKKMSEDGVAEMKEAVLKQAADYLPLSGDKVPRTDAFHAVDLLINEQKDDINETATDNSQIPCHDLLERFEGNNVLCEGEPGSGKTTLLKTLLEDFVTQGKEKFRGVSKFDLLLHMECRNNSITTIEQWLEQIFPKSLMQLNKEEAVMALHELNLLICVDGLDELTSRTRKLLEELIRKFGHSGNATFIFTSRPGQAKSISLSFQTVTIQPITEEEQKLAFLRRYQENIKGFRGPALIKSFKSLNDACKAVLCQPVYLALFCGIFRQNPLLVKKWKTEIHFQNDFLSLSKRTMITRMNSMDLENTECYADDMTDAIADLSLCLLQRQEMTVGVKTYKKMCRDIFGARDVSYYAIFSSFVTRQDDQLTFQFYHKSTVEFLAANAILNGLLDKPTNGVMGTINAITNARRGWIQTFE